MQDNTTLSLYDGTGRSAVIFELDTNQQASAYIEEAEPMRKMGTGDITVTSSSVGRLRELNIWSLSMAMATRSGCTRFLLVDGGWCI